MSFPAFAKKHWYITFLLFFFLGIYIIVFQGYHYHWKGLRNFGYFLFVVSAFSIMFMLSEQLESKVSLRRKRIVERVIPIIMVFIFFILFSALFCAIDSYKEYQLEKYGEEVTGKVVHLNYETYRRSSSVYAVISYRYKGQEYIQEVSNDSYLYYVNENLKLFCSSEHPEIIKVIGAFPPVNTE